MFGGFVEGRIISYIPLMGFSWIGLHGKLLILFGRGSSLQYLAVGPWVLPCNVIVHPFETLPNLGGCFEH